MMLCRIFLLLWTSFAVVVNVSAEGTSSAITLDGSSWKLATDPNNVGVAEKWFSELRPESMNATVPGLIQDTFPGYAGAAWYWRDISIPVNPHEDGRYLLRFWDVDYLADVWVNG